MPVLVYQYGPKQAVPIHGDRRRDGPTCRGSWHGGARVDWRACAGLFHHRRFRAAALGGADAAGVAVARPSIIAIGLFPDRDGASAALARTTRSQDHVVASCNRAAR